MTSTSTTQNINIACAVCKKKADVIIGNHAFEESVFSCKEHGVIIKV